jgi:predicted nucleic acid-binding protein
MKFWDSSAILPLIVEEAPTEHMITLAKADGELWVWWSTLLECRAAIGRRFREGALSLQAREKSLELLLELSYNWHEIQPSSSLREIASRLVATHSLRSADALQLAAALVASLNEPRGDTFITFDQRLARAAAMEGYKVPFGISP